MYGLPRLLDIGLQHLTNLIVDMANLSSKTVAIAIESYKKGKKVTKEIFAQSEHLRMLQDEVSELAVELIARYQPVASDLRYIKACMEIAYGFSRFGRYAYDIVETVEMFGDATQCDIETNGEIEKMSKAVMEMIDVSNKSFLNRDAAKADLLEKMDDKVDEMYVQHVKRVLESPERSLSCNVSATLIMRYLERIADHANYIGETARYIVKGERRPRR